MHFYVVTISVAILSIISLLLISIGGLQNTETRTVAILGLAALLFMFVGSIGSVSFPKSALACSSVLAFSA